MLSSYLKSLFCLLVIGNLNLQAQNTYKFLQLDFDEARVYLYDGSRGQLIVENGIADSTIVNVEGYKLSETELHYFDTLLSDTTGYEKIDTILIRKNLFRKQQLIEFRECDVAFCFMPHHGVVFYKDKKVVGQISICFGCNQIQTDLGQTKLCTSRIVDLFNSFQLKVEGNYYQVTDRNLQEAITQFNIKRYGVEYVAKRANKPYFLNKKN